MANPSPEASARLATLESLLSSVRSYREEVKTRQVSRGYEAPPVLALAPLEIPAVPMTATPDVRGAERAAQGSSKVTTDRLPLFLSPPASAPVSPEAPRAPEPTALLPQVFDAPARPVEPDLAPRPPEPAPGLSDPRRTPLPRPTPYVPGASPSSSNNPFNPGPLKTPLPGPSPLANREGSGSFRAVPKLIADASGLPALPELRRPSAAPSTQSEVQPTLGAFLKKFNLST